MDEAGLFGLLDTRDGRKNKRLLADRYFLGTVATVDASKTVYQTVVIQVQRVGEQVTDPHWHAAPDPNYTPQVGDMVALAWSDDKVAYVVAPLTPTLGGSLQQVTLYGNDPGITGTPPAGARFLEQRGLRSGVTDASSNITITFPVAFPSGLLDVVVSPFVPSGTLGEVFPLSGTVSQTVIKCNSTAGVGLGSGVAVKICWRATGW